MDQLELSQRVMAAVNMLIARDSVLITQEAAEWSITSRLARYLEDELPGWHVDCEYNRQGEGTRSKRNEEGDLVRPDIAVHHRGHSELDHNLLAVELKRSKDSEKDEEKARDYTAPASGDRTLQYRYAVVINLNGVPLLKWFKDGADAS